MLAHLFGHHHVERRLFGNIQQNPVFEGALHFCLNAKQRIIPVVRDMFVKLVVFLVADVALVA